jgi:hypothetical protein
MHFHLAYYRQHPFRATFQKRIGVSLTARHALAPITATVSVEERFEHKRSNAVHGRADTQLKGFQIDPFFFSRQGDYPVHFFLYLPAKRLFKFFLNASISASLPASGVGIRSLSFSLVAMISPHRR